MGEGASVAVVLTSLKGERSIRRRERECDCHAGEVCWHPQHRGQGQRSKKKKGLEGEESVAPTTPALENSSVILKHLSRVIGKRGGWSISDAGRKVCTNNQSRWVQHSQGKGKAKGSGMQEANGSRVFVAPFSLFRVGVHQQALWCYSRSVDQTHCWRDLRAS